MPSSASEDLHIREAYLRDQVNGFNSAIADLEAKFNGSVEALRQELEHDYHDLLDRLVAEIPTKCEYILSEVRQVTVEYESQRLQSAIATNAALESLRADIDEVRVALYESRGSALSRDDDGELPGATAVGSLEKLLRKAIRKFWVLVAGLLTPKEWTLSGEVSLDGFIFEGKAGIAIKFGP